MSAFRSWDSILPMPGGCCEQGLTSLVSISSLFNTFPWRLFVSLSEVQCAIFNPPFNCIMKCLTYWWFMCTCMCVCVSARVPVQKSQRMTSDIIPLAPLTSSLPPIPEISSKGHFIWPFSHGLQQLNSYLHTKHFADCAISQIPNNYCFCFTLIFYSSSQNI